MRSNEGSESLPRSKLDRRIQKPALRAESKEQSLNEREEKREAKRKEKGKGERKEKGRVSEKPLLSLRPMLWPQGLSQDTPTARRDGRGRAAWPRCEKAGLCSGSK